MWNLIVTIVLGALIGWVASIIMKSNLTLLWSILLGVGGSVVGKFLAGLIGIHGSGIGGFIISVAGACLLVFLARKLKK